MQAAGRLILLDLGSGACRALLRHDLNFSQVDIIALSHLHPDHIGDLVPFLFATHYSLGYTRPEPFWLLAARGFQDFYARLQGAFGQWVGSDSTSHPSSMRLAEGILAAHPDHIVHESVKMSVVSERQIPLEAHAVKAT